MRNILFALVAVAACADNNAPPNDDDDNGSDDGSGDGSGSGSNDDPVAPNEAQQDYDDVAASLGANLAVGDIASFVDAVNMAYGRMPTGFSIQQGPDYQLVIGTRGGLTVEYKLFCRDTADLYHPCDGFEDHAHVNPKYTGAIDGKGMDGIDRKAQWIVRDTVLPTPRVGGDGSHKFKSHLATGDYVLDVDDKLNWIHYANTPGAPVNGSIELTVTVNRTRTTADPPDRTFTVVGVVAFDGTDIALITLDATQRYSLSLSTGAVVKL